MKLRVAAVLGLLILLGMIVGSPIVAAAQQAVVQAVLFHSPTCPACRVVKADHLPPLQEQYGDQLQLLEVNVQTVEGQQMYQAYAVAYNVPQERLGVPALVVGDVYLVGSLEIPESFPGIIEQGLQAGGIPWPDLPGVSEYYEKYGLNEEARVSMSERFLTDPLGNSISTIVLLGLVASAIYLGYANYRGEVRYRPWPRWVIPILTLIGIGISLYLSIIEINHSEAVCGPIGDCNAVQGSTYAYFFGIPVALLGLIGYVGIAAAWAVQNIGPAKYNKTATSVLWWIAFLGTVFSIYLTFLEPFVIGATCAWCLASAATITLLLWAATPEVVEVRHGPQRRKKQRRLQAKGVR